MSATQVGVSEFDRFGPWIDEVEVPEDVPRLFRAHPINFGAARAVLKVPRNVARRDVTADMDLYDHMLILEQEQLTVLSRQAGKARRGVISPHGPGYGVLAVAVSEIVAIHDVVNLLDGRLTVSTSRGAAITVQYNGSARAKVTRLVGLLKDAAGMRKASPVGLALLAVAGAAPTGAAALDAGPADMLLVSDYLEVGRANPDLVAWAVHGRRSMRPDGSGPHGVLRRVSHALSPMTLHGAVFSADARAMEVFGRHAFLVRGGAPLNSSSRLVIPLGALDDMDLSRHPDYPGATVVTIRAGAWAAELAVPAGSVAERILRSAVDVDHSAAVGAPHPPAPA